MGEHRRGDKMSENLREEKSERQKGEKRGGKEKIVFSQIIDMQDTVPHSVPQMQPVPEETDAGNSE